MTKNEVMKKLESLGTEQCRKTYARHGVTGEMFGVRYADIYKIVKSIGTDQKLAEELCKTGNHDARTVAAMIADPEKMTAAALDSWAKTATNALTLDAVAKLAATTTHAKKCFEKWTKSKDEWTAAAGWHLFAVASGGREASATIAALPDSFFENQLAQIEKNIHASPNRVRYSMNAAVIGIGLRNASLRDKALAAAKRIGKVEVDHGDTSCQTPDAYSYIQKAASRGAKKTSRASRTKKKTSRKKAKTQARR